MTDSKISVTLSLNIDGSWKSKVEVERGMTVREFLLMLYKKDEYLGGRMFYTEMDRILVDGEELLFVTRAKYQKHIEVESLENSRVVS